MKKFLVGAAAALLAVALAAPSYAAEFKYTGIFRLRGVTADDVDRNKKTHDGVQFYDSLVRPRFTATSEGGKIFAIWELDFDAGNQVQGGAQEGAFGGTDPGVAVNRWIVDFAVPGTTLRARFGRTDWTSPDNEIFDSNGTHRIDGLGVYGKLFGPFSLSFFTAKVNDARTAVANDTDNHYLAVKWQAAPQIAITPWVALSRRNQSNVTGVNGFDAWYLALNANAKVGILDLDVTGVFQTGDAVEATRANRTAGQRDIDIEAWALLLRSWLNFGNLKIGFWLTVLSGDDDTTSAFSNTAQQTDRKLSRFTLPAGSGWFDGPQILTARRWSSIGLGANAAGGGNVSRRTYTGNVGGLGPDTTPLLNGVVIPEILAEYQVTPALRAEASVSFVRSAKKPPDICTAANFFTTGVCPAANLTSFTNEKNFGTEIDAGIRWAIYKQLNLWLYGSYLAAGDFGKARGAKAFDDTWQVGYELRHNW